MVQGNYHLLMKDNGRNPDHPVLVDVSLSLCMKHQFSFVSMDMYDHEILGLQQHSWSPGLFLCSCDVGISSI